MSLDPWTDKIQQSQGGPEREDRADTRFHTCAKRMDRQDGAGERKGFSELCDSSCLPFNPPFASEKKGLVGHSTEPYTIGLNTP